MSVSPEQDKMRSQLAAHFKPIFRLIARISTFCNKITVMSVTNIHNLQVEVVTLARASPNSSKVILNLDTSRNLATLPSQVVLLLFFLPFLSSISRLPWPAWSLPWSTWRLPWSTWLPTSTWGRLPWIPSSAGIHVSPFPATRLSYPTQPGD